MDNILAHKIVKKVQRDYNKIAEEFSNRRTGLSDDILAFGKYILPHDRVLDYGCGNGRLYELIQAKKAEYLGVDNSVGMLDQAKKSHHDAKFQMISEEKLNFANETFDVVLALAVFHHVPSLALRKKLLQEIARVTKSGGKIILTVWDLEVNDEGVEKMPGTDEGDILHDFKNSKGEVLAKRYIHIFSANELRDLIESADLEILELYQNDRGKRKISHNLVAIAQKR